MKWDPVCEMTTDKRGLKWGSEAVIFLREMLGWFEEIRICPIGLRRQTWARDSKDTTSEKTYSNIEYSSSSRILSQKTTESGHLRNKREWASQTGVMV